MTVDVQPIIQKYPNVHEINEVVGIWEIDIESHPVELKIKVIKTIVDSAPYMGIANYSIQNPDQEDSYRSLRNCQTIQEALDDALKGFLSYFKPELVDKTKFELDEDW